MSFARFNTHFVIGGLWLTGTLVAACSLVNQPDDAVPVATTTTGTGGMGGMPPSPECGDGNLDTDIGEYCNPKSTCPEVADCDDSDACTIDDLLGSSAACTARCENVTITTCKTASDGCCPDTCTGANDPDCAVCDNDTVEQGETCDPPSSCPVVADCDDNVACTEDTISGSAAECTAACENTPITACTPGDRCCPDGCTKSDDSDCDREIVIVHGGGANQNIADVMKKLNELDFFTLVEAFNGGAATPTLAELQAYDAALVYGDGGWNSATMLGDNLKAYVDGGGRVVTTALANCDGANALEGAWIDSDYHLITIAAQVATASGLVKVTPASPLLDNVDSLSAATALRCGVVNANTDGTAVATWTDAAPLIVEGTVGAGSKRVDLNFYPISGDVNGNLWSGDGAEILRNALMHQ